MNEKPLEHSQKSEWFAIRTRQDFRAEEELKPFCDEVFFPKETVAGSNNKLRIRAVIPHVLFIKTNRQTALALEDEGRKNPEKAIKFWIYRFPTDNRIQVIPQSSIDLLYLLTSDDTSGCEIYNNLDFKENEHVRVVGGRYRGLTGYVQRVKKNKHVVDQNRRHLHGHAPLHPPRFAGEDRVMRRSSGFALSYWFLRRNCF